MHAEQRTQQVVVERDRCGTEKQQREAVEDQTVRGAGGAVATRDRAMAEHGREHALETRQQPGREPGRGAADCGTPAVFPDLDVDAVAEHSDGRIADRIEQPYRRG
jgi:hypothetical protein